MEPKAYYHIYKRPFLLVRPVLSQMNSVIVTFCVFKIGFVRVDYFPSTARTSVSVVDYSSVWNSHTHTCHISRSSDLQQFYGAQNNWCSMQTKTNLSLPTSWRRMWEEKCSSTQSYPRRQMDVSGKYLVLAALPAGKNPRTLWVRAWVVPPDIFGRGKFSWYCRGFRLPILVECRPDYYGM